MRCERNPGTILMCYCYVYIDLIYLKYRHVIRRAPAFIIIINTLCSRMRPLYICSNHFTVQYNQHTCLNIFRSNFCAIHLKHTHNLPWFACIFPSNPPFPTFCLLFSPHRGNFGRWWSYHNHHQNNIPYPFDSVPLNHGHCDLNMNISEYVFYDVSGQSLSELIEWK